MHCACSLFVPSAFLTRPIFASLAGCIASCICLKQYCLSFQGMVSALWLLAVRTASFALLSKGLRVLFPCCTGPCLHAGASFSKVFSQNLCVLCNWARAEKGV